MFKQYIGYSAFIVDNHTEKSIKVQQPEDEYKVARRLIDDGDDFRRTQSDIELVYTEVMKGQRA